MAAIGRTTPRLVPDAREAAEEVRDHDPPPEIPRACGHERTPENTLVDKNGNKRCKPCREEYKATHGPDQTCSAPGCDRPVTANGLCNRDYQRMRNKGNTEDRVLMTPEERE